MAQVTGQSDAATRSDDEFIAALESPAAKRLYRALDRLGGFWRDYDFNDFEDLEGLRDTLHEFVLEAHTAIKQLEAK